MHASSHTPLMPGPAGQVTCGSGVVTSAGEVGGVMSGNASRQPSWPGAAPCAVGRARRQHYRRRAYRAAFVPVLTSHIWESIGPLVRKGWASRHD
jgi:hypothetical protein